MGDEDKTVEHEDLEPSTGMNHTASTNQQIQVNLKSYEVRPNYFLKERTIHICFQIYDRIVFFSLYHSVNNSPCSFIFNYVFIDFMRKEE